MLTLSEIQAEIDLIFKITRLSKYSQHLDVNHIRIKNLLIYIKSHHHTITSNQNYIDTSSTSYVDMNLFDDPDYQFQMTTDCTQRDYLAAGYKSFIPPSRNLAINVSIEYTKRLEMYNESIDKLVKVESTIKQEVEGQFDKFDKLYRLIKEHHHDIVVSDDVKFIKTKNVEYYTFPNIKGFAIGMSNKSRSSQTSIVYNNVQEHSFNFIKYPIFYKYDVKAAIDLLILQLTSLKEPSQ